MIYNNSQMLQPQALPGAGGNGPLVQPMARPPMQPRAPAGGFAGAGGSDTRAKLTQAIMEAMQKKAASDAANNPGPWTAMGNAAAQMAGAYSNRKAQGPVMQKYKSKMPTFGAPKKIPGG